MENNMASFLKSGKETEKRFCEALEKNGYQYTVSSREEDKYEHWDVRIIVEKWPGFRCDVKGMKKVARLDPHPSENFHWVELVGITGKWGWLYGEAEDFAFETEDYWLLVTKEKLQNFVAKRCVKEMVDNPYQALYKMYQRDGRKDIMTLVKTIDLILECKPIVIKK